MKKALLKIKIEVLVHSLIGLNPKLILLCLPIQLVQPKMFIIELLNLKDIILQIEKPKEIDILDDQEGKKIKGDQENLKDNLLV